MRTIVFAAVAAFTTAAGVLVLAADPASAQSDKTNAAAPKIAGTWDVAAMSHQFALVIDEVKDVKKVTGTLMIMGQDVLLDGDFTDGTLTLTSPSKIGSPGSHEMVPIKLTGKLAEDDKLEGEMATGQGAVKWTAERLRKK